MKKILFSALLLCALFSFTGCSEKSYVLKKSIEQIESIDIGWAKSSLEYEVSRTLSEAERSDFLREFQTIKFHTYLIGDPMSVYGDAVKITYQSGDYEIISYCWAEYVKNGEIYFVRKNNFKNNKANVDTRDY